MDHQNIISNVEEKAKILIVDDEKVNLDVLDGLLKPHYRTVVAKSGQQALKRLDKHPLPDLILLDITMPVMDGYAVCRAIKNNLLTRGIPIIFITGKSEEQDEAFGFQVGAVDYIVKPFSPLVTLARVKTHVDLKKRGDLLQQQATLDGLTGIPNRRRFDEFLEYEWERSLRFQHPLSVILVDIDFFKLYNDHFGHAQGDICLKQVAKAIIGAMPRTIDLASRYGGEEFSCILPETSADGALIVARRILENCRNLKLPHPQSKTTDHVTLSLGTATTTPTQNLGKLDIVEMADKALYVAKKSGRNQIQQFAEGN